MRMINIIIYFLLFFYFNQSAIPIDDSEICKPYSVVQVDGRFCVCQPDGMPEICTKTDTDVDVFQMWKI